MFPQEITLTEFERLSAIRSARARVAAAKVVALRGDMTGNAVGYLMLDGMRIMGQSRVGYAKVELIARDGGFALCLQISHGPRVWLITERSKRVRVWKRIDTAIPTIRALGA